MLRDSAQPSETSSTRQSASGSEKPVLALKDLQENLPATVAAYLHIQGWAGHSSEIVSGLANHGQLWRLKWMQAHTAASIWRAVQKNWKEEGLPPPLPLDKGCGKPSAAVP